MSLTDVDKDSLDRGSPTPNHSDLLADGAVKAHQTLSTVYTTDATANPTVRLVHKNNMILTYDASNNVSSVYGYIPNVGTTPVFIVAKAGKDVFTDVLNIAKPAGL